MADIFAFQHHFYGFISGSRQKLYIQVRGQQGDGLFVIQFHIVVNSGQCQHSIYGTAIEQFPSKFVASN